MKLLRPLLAALAVSLASASARAAERAILISVDGMHALDLALWVKNNPDSAFAQLAKRGVTYTNARTPLLGDSTPGLVSLATGATPATAGLIYSPFYDRSLVGAGVTDGTKGALYTIDEKWILDPTREDSGGGIDVKKLPRDPAKGNAPVYPHDLVRVNTMFEVVRAAGGRTAWIDQHILYNDLLNGPSGKGLDDSIALERKGTPQTFEGFTAQDTRRVEILLNEIRGLDSSGKNKVGVPKLFGMGFISFGALQKSEGYANARGGLGEKNLRATLRLVDDSLGRIVTELKKQNLYDSTLLIVSSKHGQSPIDIKQRRLIDRTVIRDAVNSVQPDLLMHAALDTIGLLYLRDSSKTNAVADVLRARAAEAGILKVYHGEQLKLFLPSPDTDPRMPDILIQPALGVFYAPDSDGPAAKALLAEHGGMLDEDVNVPLLVSFAGAPGTISRAPVFTHQVAPTILSALGLDPALLKGVQLEGTPVLPGVKWKN
jgi:Type I phosphodiesterase / nucleotide pyrophosphatase